MNMHNEERDTPDIDPLDDFSDPVEIGSGMQEQEEPPEEDPAPKEEPPSEEAGEGDGEGEETPKTKKPGQTSEYIQRLRRRLAGAEESSDTKDSELAALRSKVENLEKGLTPKEGDGTEDALRTPDPDDREKYPLGRLDDNYIEDRLSYLAAKNREDVVNESAQSDKARRENEAYQAEISRVRTQIETVASKGIEQFEDFHEVVVERSLNEEFPLDQTTFEAAVEAENGPAILYALAKDEDEAKRVAEMTPYQQLRYVQTQDSEITKAATPRSKPGAPPPPTRQPAGRQGSKTFRGDEESLDDYEAGLAAYEKANPR